MCDMFKEMEKVSYGKEMRLSKRPCEFLKESSQTHRNEK